MTNKGSKEEREGGRDDGPEIQDGIEPPVKNPTQSLVNELQLKSKRWYYEAGHQYQTR